MPTHRNLERLIGAAIVDRDFRASLLESPLSAAEGFNLSTDEMDILRSAGAGTLEELATHLHAWITKAPTPRRAGPPRWTSEDYHLARVAV
jgi:hypothetical protein